MRLPIAAFVVLASGACTAQISDEQAVLEARRYVSAFAPEALSENPRVFFRDRMDGWAPDSEYVMVSFGEVVTSLKNDGTFLCFYSMRRATLLPKGGAPDKYETDEAAWRAFEEVLSRIELDLPEGLERHRLERVSHEGQDYVYRFYMRLRPYGYETLGGWKISGEIQRITGRVVSIVHSRPGWTYEPPNVQVSESQAIEKAVETMGGPASDWRVELKYGTMNYDRAPEYFKALISQQVMRLIYRMQRYDPQTKVSSLISIDSVTGAVLSTQTLTIDSPTVENADARTGFVAESSATPKVAEKVSPPRGLDSPSVGRARNAAAESSPSLPTFVFITLAALVGMGGLVLIFRRSPAPERGRPSR